ncbi:unnamed protein product [Symbiodinium sp. CCMP2592]|nr:unnamed protein product [Symbiodinium sp. CCMP2592]
MGLNIEANGMLTGPVQSVIDKRDLLRLWNQAGKLQCGSGLDGTPRARAGSGSESTASPRRAEDDTPSELTWNPLDLHPDFLFSQGLEEDSELSELAWDPIGMASADKSRLRASVDHEEGIPESCDGNDLLLSKPPGLEDPAQGHDLPADFWSRATTAGTADAAADYEGSSGDALAAEMAAMLELIQTGQCVAPWVESSKPRSMAGAPDLPWLGDGRLPEVRGLPHWPLPGPPLFNGLPKMHNFCPWCGSARVCSHRFCPQCGVLYPDLQNALSRTAMDSLISWQY